ncbi:MAG: hypothetical protein AB7O62_09455 [Pirellulales bacterium]
MNIFCQFACPASRAARTLFAASEQYGPPPHVTMTSWGKLLIVGAVAAFVVLLAVRGGPRLARLVVGAAGALFLSGVGLVLFYNAARFDGQRIDDDWRASFAGDEKPWEMPRHDGVEFPPANLPPPPSISSAAPETLVSVLPTAEVVDAIPLEIAPATAPRPAWVGQPASLQNGVYRLAVTVGPFHATDPKAQRELSEKISRTFAQYVEADRGPAAAGHMLFSPGEIRHRFVKDSWYEPYQSPTPSLQAMVYLHALLAIDDAARREIDSRFTDIMVAQRLKQAGGAAAALLLVLASLFGYLKLDTLTRGYYSGRLKVAAAALAGVGVTTLAYWLRAS